MIGKCAFKCQSIDLFSPRPNATGESRASRQGGETRDRQLGPPHEELHEPQPAEAPHEEDADLLRPDRKLRTARPGFDRRATVQEENSNQGERTFVRSAHKH